MAEVVKVPVVWCDPWPGHEVGSWFQKPTEGVAGLQTPVKPLINFIITQLYSYVQ